MMIVFCHSILLTGWDWWIPCFISLALGCVIASQGETFMALKANGVFVHVAVLQNRYFPILDLWDWTYHLLTNGKKTTPCDILSQNPTLPVRLSNQ